LKLDAARNHLPGEPEVAEAILLELRRQVQDAISDIRRLVYNLRPPALDELGLLPALRASAEAQTPSGAPRVTVEGPSALTNLPAAVEVAAYRIAQEAVTNIARHAQASHCMLRLRLNDGLELEIADDGIGLPADMRVGVGLSSMRERTDELGGTFLIESPPEGGTRVIAHFPLTSHAP
jgi:two-component system NarL family sensor kinase